MIREARVLLGAALLLIAVAADPATAGECPIPDGLAHVDAQLPALRARLRAGGPVRIVAIGGGSTAGAAAGSLDLAYPHSLEQELARWYPKSSISVINKGVPRQSAAEMLQRFDRDVFALQPVLAIWEAGINDAVHGTDIDDFAGAMQSGIDRLKAHGIDIVLIDMQFSRTIEALIDFERYLDALHQIGEVNDIYVFPRYEIMRYWSEQHVFHFDTVGKEERAKLAADAYRCIGRRLADAIRASVR